jgi:hypothetical protein
MKMILFVLPVSLILINCAVEPEGDSGQHEISTYQIRYKVEGSIQTASISIMDENTQGRNFPNQTLPWEYIFSKKVRQGTYLYLSAQHNQTQGTVVAVIFKENEVFKSDTVSGIYATATVSGRL